MVLPIVNTVFNLYTRKLYTKKAVSSYDIIIEIIKEYFEDSKNRKEKKWIKSAEVCEIMSCSTATLFRLRTDGILPCSLVQGTYYYKLSDIDHMMVY